MRKSSSDAPRWASAALLCNWTNGTAAGQDSRRTLTIIEILSVDGDIKPDRQFTFIDCFPTAYLFPHLSVTNTTGNVTEEVRIKPIRCVRW